MISVIIPTYNEEAVIVKALECLGHAGGDFEVIVVDGASTDQSRLRAEALIDGLAYPLRVIATERGRALQMNHGARLAGGEILLFLHADTLVPSEAFETLRDLMENTPIVGGNFSLVYEGDSSWNRFFAWVNRIRRFFGIYYGDSGVFVRRSIFRRLGGFKPIPVMEDYEFVRRMEKAGRTACLAPVLTVSDRRWRVQGALRTMWSWFWIQLFYSAGIPPEHLARWYAPVRAARHENVGKLLGAPSSRFHRQQAVVTQPATGTPHLDNR